MLKVGDRFVIKDMHRRGVTISEIARITGHDRKTIRTVLNGPVNPPLQKRQTRVKKLDPRPRAFWTTPSTHTPPWEPLPETWSPAADRAGTPRTTPYLTRPPHYGDHPARRSPSPPPAP
jgi:hypothetical protein